MEKEFEINVSVKAECQNPVFGLLLNTVAISQSLLIQNDGRLQSLGLFPPPFYSPPYSKILVKLENFSPENVFLTLFGQLQEHVLSQKISDEIVLEAQRKMSQGFKQPFFLEVFVKLTHKVSNLMPSSSALPTSDSELEKTCAICLENMLGGSEDYCQMPNCSHWFHEKCVRMWLDRHKNSCPLCRQPLLD